MARRKLRLCGNCHLFYVTHGGLICDGCLRGIYGLHDLRRMNDWGEDIYHEDDILKILAKLHAKVERLKRKLKRAEEEAKGVIG